MTKRRYLSPSALFRRQRGSRRTRKRRQRLAEAQNWRCAHCGCQLEPDTATIDHVWPIGMGGPAVWENEVAACEPCNKERSRKGSCRGAHTVAEAALYEGAPA